MTISKVTRFENSNKARLNTQFWSEPPQNFPIGNFIADSKAPDLQSISGPIGLLSYMFKEISKAAYNWVDNITLKSASEDCDKSSIALNDFVNELKNANGINKIKTRSYLEKAGNDLYHAIQTASEVLANSTSKDFKVDKYFDRYSDLKKYVTEGWKIVQDLRAYIKAANSNLIK